MMTMTMKPALVLLLTALACVALGVHAMAPLELLETTVTDPAHPEWLMIDLGHNFDNRFRVRLRSHAIRERLGLDDPMVQPRLDMVYFKAIEDTPMAVAGEEFLDTTRAHEDDDDGDDDHEMADSCEKDSDYAAPGCSHWVVTHAGRRGGRSSPVLATGLELMTDEFGRLVASNQLFGVRVEALDRAGMWVMVVDVEFTRLDVISTSVSNSQ